MHKHKDLRNLFFILFILFGTLGGAQQLQYAQNVFSERDKTATLADGPGTGSDGDLEGEDVTVSVSDYIPLLLFAALGIIIYNDRKKKVN